MPIFSTKELAFKLEFADALNQVDFVKTHKKIYDNSISDYKRIGSGYAMFLGAESPITQAFALGFNDETKIDEIIELEEFYFERKSSVNIEVSHLSNMNLTYLLNERGFKVVEYTNVLVKEIDKTKIYKESFQNEIRFVSEDEIELVSQTITRAFSEQGELPETFTEIFETFYRMENAYSFISDKEDMPVGGGTVFFNNGIAILGGAGTLPEFRGLGIQTDLMKRRINLAIEKGCKLAAIVTMPGTTSQRNAEKLGFQVLYARNKFRKEF